MNDIEQRLRSAHTRAPSRLRNKILLEAADCIAELQAKVAEYEYPLRTKETVTIPFKVWDARNLQFSELRESMGLAISERDEVIAELEESYNQSHARFTTVLSEKMDLMDELAELREAVNMYLNLEDCVSLERLEALLPESSDE